MELPDLYREMKRVREFELAVADLWERGQISGEMHLGTGEEAVAAGVVTHLRDGDGLALTHRCTPPLLVRGVSMDSILRELLGRPDGLCHGRGGHMHLMSRPHLAAASGIVGASAPLAAGFALAAKRRGEGGIAVALTGDGAMNQGSLLESLNLAVAWKLPMLLVCIDNGWAIATRAGTVTAGDLGERAEGFGWPVVRVDGTDVMAVHRAVGPTIDRIRKGRGPAFLYATCPRIDGHYLGDPLLEQSRHITGDDARQTVGKIMGSVFQGRGGSALRRASSVLELVGTMARARMQTKHGDRDDPIAKAERSMKAWPDEKKEIDEAVANEVQTAVRLAMAEGAA